MVGLLVDQNTSLWLFILLARAQKNLLIHGKWYSQATGTLTPQLFNNDFVNEPPSPYRRTEIQNIILDIQKLIMCMNAQAPASD